MQSLWKNPDSSHGQRENDGLVMVHKAHDEGLKRTCMVKLKIVETSNSSSPSRPIGVIKSIVAGFEKIAAQPLLLLPPILLDLFLWLGPRLTIPAIIQQLTNLIILPSGSDEAITEQVEILRSFLLDLGERFNLFALLSNIPVGISSLLTGRMPVMMPLGRALTIPIGNFLLIFTIVLILLIVGQGLGAQFHLWIAKQVAPQKELADRGTAWLKMILLAGSLYIVGIVFSLGISFIASLFALLLPILGLMAAFLGFTLAFWAFVYLFFTPHGVIRYRLGLVRAMMESATLVRWNLLPVIGYLGSSFFISWLTNQVWILPSEDSWYLLLAIIGHAFVSATLLAGSYVFYQDRREWLFSMKQRRIVEPGRGGGI
jgi:hypothetical protein